ncbi:cytochrome c3 family protein [Ferrimonas lipolytica]|uniref:Cytochrome c3 family protein n=1 Tax=Ferrimonas lipolytica TaxID=2724191 RepID=A0A6H1UAE8_9GAMM|nr:cytochrome c3 family protein [Ferrimonas lipolytica]QIZ76035.1 cytochrome c3 family protein [Ferrimonas lipolytica]
MFKKLLVMVFGVAMAFSVSADLSEMHAEMEGCEACHAEGEPSDDGAYEVEQCAACHGELADMEGVHPAHDGLMECTDCHMPHEHEAAADVTCDECHDDGRTK